MSYAIAARRKRRGGGSSSLFGTLPREIAQIRAFLRAMRTHPIIALSFFTWLYLWSEIGAAVTAFAVTMLLLFGGSALWFAYRFQRTGLSFQEAAQNLRRQKQVRKRWVRACESVGFKAVPELGGWKRELRADRGDVLGRIYSGAYGVSTEQIAKSLPHFTDVIGCREVTMTEIGSGIIDLRFSWSDPLAKIVRPHDLGPARRGAIPHGITDRGEVMGLQALNKEQETVFTPVLIGGVSGSGKSSDVWSILAGLIAAEIPTRVRVIDPAGGVEMAALGEALDREQRTDLFAVHRYTGRSGQAEAIVKEMRSAMESRLDAMKAKGVRLHKPTPEEPLDILIVDELLLLGDMLKRGVQSEYGQLLTVGRKAGFSAIACTQIGEKAQLGAVRELHPRRICFRTNTREQTETILGSGGKADQAPAHRISDRTPGVGYAYDDSTGKILKFRAVHFPDALTQQIAQGELPAGMEMFGQARVAGGKWGLYRFYTRPKNGARRLLYLGKSNEPLRRYDEHRRNSPWFKDHDPSYGEDGTRLGFVVDWYDTKADMDEAEQRFIELEGPMYNDVYNRKNPLKVLARR